jgi:lipopolysaccharide transport system permease protein
MFNDNALTVVRYRWLLYELVVRDLTLRYRGSVLGFAWTLLNPILFMAIYTLVFSVYLPTKLHAFSLFLLAGLVPWMWVAGALGQSVTAILDGRAYVGKTLMPIELLVLVPILSNGVNFLITILFLFPVSFALGVNVGWAVIFLPLLALVELCIILGIGLLVATLNVFYRDLQQLIGYALTALFFLTPIFYAKTAVPDKLQFLVAFNPFAALISGYQSVFYYGTPPDWRDLIFAAAFGIVTLAIGTAAFNRSRDAFGEYV